MLYLWETHTEGALLLQPTWEVFADSLYMNYLIVYNKLVSKFGIILPKIADFYEVFKLYKKSKSIQYKKCLFRKIACKAAISYIKVSNFKEI